MIRKLAAAAAAAALALGSGAFASTAVTSATGDSTRIQLLSSSSQPAFESGLARSIAAAPQGSAMRLQTDQWESFGPTVTQALQSRPDVKFTIEYGRGEDACVVPVSENSLVGRLSSPQGQASFPVLCLAFTHDEAEVLARWKERDHAAFARMTQAERDYYMRTLRKEQRIRRDIIAASAAQGGELFKLVYRLKSPGSTYEKMYLRSEKMPINTVTDLVRYTVLFDEDKYTDGVKRMVAELSSRGYELGTLWNAWKAKNLSYRGINTVLCDPTNQFVEVQIHTRKSAEAADKTHGYYEKRRLQPEGSPEWHRLNDIAMGIANAVPVPDGVEAIDTYRRPFPVLEFLKEREARGNRPATLH
jgi:hypothetical protein